MVRNGAIKEVELPAEVAPYVDAEAAVVFYCAIYPMNL